MNPTQEEIEEAVSMVKYFWNHKGDITRWVGWQKWEPWFRKNRPEITDAYDRYISAVRTLNKLLEE